MRWAITEARKPRRIAKAEWKAFFKEKANVPLPQRLKDTLFKMLANVDPIEAVAIIGGTVIVHDVIFNLPLFSNTIKPMDAQDFIGTFFGGWLYWLNRPEKPQDTPAPKALKDQL